tara:strand:+ start:77 stop:640 length:564 start_codon:yes stop_codon:yes gene_type:complete
VKLKITLLKIIFTFILCTLIISSCEPSKFEYTKNKKTIESLHKIKQLNSLILENIDQLGDSCCRHLGNSCFKPDSIKRKLSYPLNRNLANKYITQKEPQIVELISLLAPGNVTKNSNAISENISFTKDSTIRYSCYKESISDTIVDHYLIYSDLPLSKLTTKESTIILEEKIDDNWTYIIVKYLYVW